MTLVILICACIMLCGYAHVHTHTHPLFFGLMFCEGEDFHVRFFMQARISLLITYCWRGRHVTTVLARRLSGNYLFYMCSINDKEQGLIEGIYCQE